MSFTPASTALARFKVLDLTRVRAGPTAARQFADWGADVIKIELPRGLDESDMGGPRHGPDFQNLHRNKRSLTLNLKEADGIAIFKRMVETADVVITSKDTGVQSYETPPIGEPTRAKVMVPVKPFRASTLRLSVPIELAATVIVVDVGVRL